jgi:hypothetical protein
MLKLKTKGIMIFSFFLLFAILAATKYVQAATINAASCSSNDVQTALNNAKAGDIVSIPAGSCVWTGEVSWTAPANATLQGAGTNAIGGEDRTVIIDNYSANNTLLEITVPATGKFRMTGISFRSGTGAIKDGGTITFNGPGTVRLDHLHLQATSAANYKILNIGSGVFGVLDHSILDLYGTNAIYIYNGRSGSGDWMANLEWSYPTNFGGADFFFIEDNIVNGTSGGNAYDTRLFDGFTGARVVARFNTLVSTVLGETHATGHSPDDRGLRAQEIYGNSVTSPLIKDPNFCMLDISNGTALAWGNSMNNVYKNIFIFKTTRINNGTYPQSATPNGW